METTKTELLRDLEKTECLELLRENYIARLAFISQGRPYIVPITYYYDEKEHSIVSYSGEGHKIDALRKNPEVCVEIDEIGSISEWRSVLVHAEYEEIEQIDAKYQLHRFAERVKENILVKKDTCLRFIKQFSSKTDAKGHSVVYRLKISEMTGKSREE